MICKMGSQSFFGCLIVMWMGLLLGLSKAYKFQVGGKEGWVLHPKEDYNHWAERNRFQVNDTLYFKYKKGSDSVLIVSKDDYYSCNTKNASQSLTDGDSIFKFNRSGPFFFIASNADKCKKGQKMIIVVMAVRHKTHPPPPPPPPPPTAVPLAPSPIMAAAPPPVFVPSPLSPPLPSPPAESPQSSLDRSGPSESPPPPISSGPSKGFTGSARLALGASFGLSVILGGLVGLV